METRTSFSSIGPSFDNRIKPDVMARINGCFIRRIRKYSYGKWDFSSPLYGMVACLWQAFPNKTNKEIRQLIIQSADRFTAADNQYGYGIPDFNLALKWAVCRGFLKRFCSLSKSNN
jgi:hypothetical protein